MTQIPEDCVTKHHVDKRITRPKPLRICAISELNDEQNKCHLPVSDRRGISAKTPSYTKTRSYELGHDAKTLTSQACCLTYSQHRGNETSLSTTIVILSTQTLYRLQHYIPYISDKAKRGRGCVVVPRERSNRAIIPRSGRAVTKNKHQFVAAPSSVDRALIQRPVFPEMFPESWP